MGGCRGLPRSPEGSNTRNARRLYGLPRKNNLANSLQLLSEDDDDLLEKAFAGYHEAPQRKDRELVPLGWAETKSCLARAYIKLGERPSAA